MSNKTKEVVRLLRLIDGMIDSIVKTIDKNNKNNKDLEYDLDDLASAYADLLNMIDDNYEEHGDD
jgi:Na+/phosphate symporter